MTGESGRGHGAGAFKRAVLVALLAWGAYAAVAVAVNGVVLDESVVPGQIVAGATVYPAGHPHDVFYRSAYTASHFIAAGLWAVGVEEVGISAMRNWLFLLASIFAVFLPTLVLTRRPSWAHAAVAFTLLDAYMRYRGVYPLYVLPHYYSNGHIGLQSLIIVASLLAARSWKVGGLLLGLMPAVHAVMALFAWGWAALFLLGTGVYRDPSARKSFLTGFAPGAALSAALGLLIVLLPDAQAAAAPYLTGLDAEAARAGFLATTDVHRGVLPVGTLGYRLNSAAFAALILLLWGSWRGDDDPDSAPLAGPTLWIAALGLLAWVAVWGAWTLQQVTGWMPDLLVTVMPWRFSNVSAVLLVPLTLAALHRVSSRSSDVAAGWIAALVGVVTLGAGVASLPFTPVVDRALVSANLLFGLWGVLLGSALWAARDHARLLVPALGAALLLFGATGSYWGLSYMAAYLVASTLGTLGLLWLTTRWQWAPRGLMASVPSLLVVGVVISATAAIPGRRADEVEIDSLRWDMMSDDDRAIRAWLEEFAEPTDPVLTPINPRAELQSKTGQPVLLELETLWLMTYMPDLAGVVGRMVRDLYGVDYTDNAETLEACGGHEISIWCPVWDETWGSRTRTRWAELGEAYGFRYVMALNRVGVDLDPVVAGARWSLYRIPGGASRP